MTISSTYLRLNLITLANPTGTLSHLYLKANTHRDRNRQSVTKQSKGNKAKAVLNVVTKRRKKKIIHLWPPPLEHTKKQNPHTGLKRTTSYGLIRKKRPKSIHSDLLVWNVKGDWQRRDNRRRSPVFSQGSVGQQMAEEHRNCGKRGGMITALSLCRQVASFLNKAQTHGLMIRNCLYFYQLDPC